jgi:hypothetical protein
MLDQLKGEDAAADTAAEVLLLRIRIANPTNTPPPPLPNLSLPYPLSNRVFNTTLPPYPTDTHPNFIFAMYLHPSVVG